MPHNAARRSDAQSNLVLHYPAATIPAIGMTGLCFLSIAATRLSPVKLTQADLGRIAVLDPGRPGVFTFGTIQEPTA